MTRPGFHTVCNFVTKPPSDNDWCAFRDGDEPNDNGVMSKGVGYGRTPEEAIADLVENHPLDDAPAVTVEVA